MKKLDTLTDPKRESSVPSMDPIFDESETSSHLDSSISIDFSFDDSNQK